MFLLAERLGKTVSEIRRMPSSEFYAWIAFDGYRESQREHAEKVAEMRAEG